MHSLSFPVYFIPQEGGGYTVTCPVLPGCHSQGQTRQDAENNIREAIELVIEDMIEQGEPIPDGAGAFAANVEVAGR